MWERRRPRVPVRPRRSSRAPEPGTASRAPRYLVIRASRGAATPAGPAGLVPPARPSGSEDNLHARRVLSLANGVTGVLRVETLNVHAFGEGYAEVARTKPRFGVKQVDRPLEQRGDRRRAAHAHVDDVRGRRAQGDVIALDWTDFEKDDHTTPCAYLVTSHGRATPLTWKTVKKSSLADHRNDFAYQVIDRIHSALAPDVAVPLLADRAFGDQEALRTSSSRSVGTRHSLPGRDPRRGRCRNSEGCGSIAAATSRRIFAT